MLINASLGPYTILEKLGEGGMGQVYMGEDTRLGRKVAIKVLPAEFAAIPERLSRFEREARAAAALNHPNIAAVFDVGSETMVKVADGIVTDPDAPTAPAPVETVHFMVQEYLVGLSLRDRIDRGALTLDESLSVAADVAGALSAAHDAGIVHRDLKPDNVFITEAGHVKVLDFGLAKLTQTDADDGSDPQSKSGGTVADSAAGRVLGTPGYMAPEQANGEPADRRADMFAFGCMLYEMAAGQKPFEGRTSAEVMYRIVHEDPEPLAEVSAALPLELQRIVNKCLQKQAPRRYQHAGDLAIDLSTLLADLGEGRAVSIAAATGKRAGAADDGLASLLARPGWAGAVGIAILAAMIGWGLRPAAPTPPATPMRFSINLPADVSITRTERPIIAVSRDGTRIVAAADSALYYRDLAEEEFHLVEGTAPASTGYAVAPALSPDGGDVAFFLEDAIRRVSVTGGATTTLTAAVIPLSIHWAADGYVYYSQAGAAIGSDDALTGEDIWRVPEGGGTAELIVEAGDGRRVSSPQVLPGGEWLLHSTASATDLVAEAAAHEDLVVQSLITGDRHTIVEGGGFAGQYLETGHIVFVEDSALWAVPFDLAQLQVDGGAVRILDQVPVSLSAGTGYFGLSDSGTLVVPALSVITDRNGDISWVDPDGKIEELGIARADNPRISADGSKVVAEVRGAEPQIWIHEIDSGSWTRLETAVAAEAPVWSSDGRSVFFTASGPELAHSIWQQAADFSSPAEVIWTPDGHRPFPESTPDHGRFLLYSAGLPDQNDVWLLWLDGRGAAPLIETPDVSEEGTQVHPSGRWFAYTSRESGRYEVYVRELADDATVGRRYAISTAGGAEPLWSRDGSTLFYRVGTQLRAVEIDTENGLRVGDTRLVMPEFPGDAPVLRADYDVTLDGRFITAIPLKPFSASRLDVVVNWFAQPDLLPTVDQR